MKTRHIKRQKMPCFTKAMQFRIDLLDTCPQIWRRFQVPNSYSFWDLHCAITDVMPWKDYHLHVFKLNQLGKRKPIEIGIPDDEGFDDIEVLPGWKIFIKDYFTKNGDHAEYVYDFGDDWIHGLLFEGFTDPQTGVQYPICLDGKMASPPEDCGGISGYENFKKAISNPSHPEHKHLLAWIGGKFDPVAFDPKAVQFLDPFKRFRVAFCGEPAPKEWEWTK